MGQRTVTMRGGARTSWNCTRNAITPTPRLRVVPGKAWERTGLGTRRSWFRARWAQVAARCPPPIDWVDRAGTASPVRPSRASPMTLVDGHVSARYAHDALPSLAAVCLRSRRSVVAP